MTQWLIRLSFPGLVPADPVVRDVVTSAGFAVETLAGVRPDTPNRWLLVAARSRADVEAGIARLAKWHRIETVALPRVSG